MKKLNLPCILSISRIFFLPLLFILVYSDRPYLFLTAFILVGSTDFFDGIVARRWNMRSDFGKTLDSVADLFFYIPAAYFLWYLFPEVITPNKIYLIVFFSLLGFSFLLSGILFKKPVMMHTSILRFNGVLVYAVVILSFFFNTTILVRIALLSYIIGFTEEVLIFIFFGNVDPDTKSIFHLIKDKNKHNTLRA